MCDERGAHNVGGKIDAKGKPKKRVYTRKVTANEEASAKSIPSPYTRARDSADTTAFR